MNNTIEKKTEEKMLITVTTEPLTFLDFIKTLECHIPKMYINTFHKQLLMNSTDQIVWVALTDELVDLIGFKGVKKRKTQSCMNILSRNFEEDIDYKEVEEENFMHPYGCIEKNRKYGNKKRFYMITGDCVEQLLMMTRTDTAKKTRANYIQLRKLITKYSKYQNTYAKEKSKLQIEEKTQLLIESKEQLNRINKINKDLVDYKKFINKSEILYIGSTMAYARQGLWKISKTKNLKSRTSANNSSHVHGDNFIIFHSIETWNSLHLEKRLHELLQHTRPVRNREYFLIPWNLLMNIIDIINKNYEYEIDKVNEIVDQIHELNQETINWTEGLDLDKYNAKATLTITANGEEKTTTFDMDTMSSAELIAGIIDCINLYATDQGHDWDYITDKNDKTLNIIWKDLQKYIISLFNIRPYKFKATKWKILMKQLNKDGEKINIKWTKRRKK